MGFENGLVFGEGVVGVKVQLMAAGFKVEVAEGDEIVLGPLGEFDEDSAFASHFFEFFVGVFEEVAAHRLHVGVEDVVESFRPAVGVLVGSAEVEGFDQAVAGQELVGRADQFGDVVGPDEDGNHMRATGVPDNDFIIGLKKMERFVNIKQFRVNRSIKEMEG